ncbi:hypothetical protein C8R45DRAFT_933375 [Mycena sanguinolenta]|nr:hypothetical protein C8R45DRAFT_933375 [Mycena sanguinolenta]
MFVGNKTWVLGKRRFDSSLVHNLLAGTEHQVWHTRLPNKSESYCSVFVGRKSHPAKENNVEPDNKFIYTYIGSVAETETALAVCGTPADPVQLIAPKNLYGELRENSPAPEKARQGEKPRVPNPDISNTPLSPKSDFCDLRVDDVDEQRRGRCGGVQLGSYVVPYPARISTLNPTALAVCGTPAEIQCVDLKMSSCGGLGFDSPSQGEKKKRSKGGERTEAPVGTRRFVIRQGAGRTRRRYGGCKLKKLKTADTDTLQGASTRAGWGSIPRWCIAATNFQCFFALHFVFLLGDHAQVQLQEGEQRERREERRTCLFTEPASVLQLAAHFATSRVWHTRQLGEANSRNKIVRRAGVRLPAGASMSSAGSFFVLLTSKERKKKKHSEGDERNEAPVGTRSFMIRKRQGGLADKGENARQGENPRVRIELFHATRRTTDPSASSQDEQAPAVCGTLAYSIDGCSQGIVRRAGVRFPAGRWEDVARSSDSMLERSPQQLTEKQESMSTDKTKQEATSKKERTRRK